MPPPFEQGIRQRDHPLGENDSHYLAIKSMEYAIMGNTHMVLAFPEQTPIFLNHSLKLSTAAL